MERTKNTDAQATEQKTVGPDTQQVDVDTGTQAPVPDGAPETAGATLETSGSEAETEPVAGALQPYAIAFKGVLRLRQEPCLDAPIIATLPCGAGVFADGEPGPDGWLHVRTGRLAGWMMAEYLEALPLPNLGDGTD